MTDYWALSTTNHYWSLTEHVASIRPPASSHVVRWMAERGGCTWLVRGAILRNACMCWRHVSTNLESRGRECKHNFEKRPTCSKTNLLTSIHPHPELPWLQGYFSNTIIEYFQGSGRCDLRYRQNLIWSLSRWRMDAVYYMIFIDGLGHFHIILACKHWLLRHIVIRLMSYLPCLERLFKVECSRIIKGKDSQRTKRRK